MNETDDDVNRACKRRATGAVEQHPCIACRLPLINSHNEPRFTQSYHCRASAYVRDHCEVGAVLQIDLPSTRAILIQRQSDI